MEQQKPILTIRYERLVQLFYIGTIAIFIGTLFPKEDDMGDDATAILARIIILMVGIGTVTFAAFFPKRWVFIVYATIAAIWLILCVGAGSLFSSTRLSILGIGNLFLLSGFLIKPTQDLRPIIQIKRNE